MRARPKFPLWSGWVGAGILVGVGISGFFVTIVCTHYYLSGWCDMVQVWVVMSGRAVRCM